MSCRDHSSTKYSFPITIQSCLLRSYKVLEQDEGHGVDVTLLHHDVGLVRTKTAMKLAAMPFRSGSRSEPLAALLNYNPHELNDKEVEVHIFSVLRLNMVCLSFL